MTVHCIPLKPLKQCGVIADLLIIGSQLVRWLLALHALYFADLPLCGPDCIRAGLITDAEITFSEAEVALEVPTWEIAERTLFEVLAPMYVPTRGTGVTNHKWCCVLADILKTRTCKQVSVLLSH